MIFVDRKPVNKKDWGYPQIVDNPLLSLWLERWWGYYRVALRYFFRGTTEHVIRTRSSNKLITRIISFMHRIP